MGNNIKILDDIKEDKGIGGKVRVLEGGRKEFYGSYSLI